MDRGALSHAGTPCVTSLTLNVLASTGFPITGPTRTYRSATPPGIHGPRRQNACPYSTVMGASAGATAFARKCFQLAATRMATAIASVPTKDKVNSSQESSLLLLAVCGDESMRSHLPTTRDGQSSPSIIP